MDFGISLDPLAVSQRHELYDSESEEEEDETGEQNRADPAPEEGSGDFITGRSLIIGLGSTASVFVRSFVCLRESPSLSLPAEAAEIRAGEKNAQSGHEREEIAAVELYETQGNSQWVVCAHSKELRAENCNRWTEKVYLAFSLCTYPFCVVIILTRCLSKVFGQGKPDHVLVYVCRSLHEYFSSFPVDEDTVNIVRCLCSSSWPHPPGGVALEAPNSIKGEAAAS